MKLTLCLSLLCKLKFVYEKNTHQKVLSLLFGSRRSSPIFIEWLFMCLKNNKMESFLTTFCPIWSSLIAYQLYVKLWASYWAECSQKNERPCFFVLEALNNCSSITGDNLLWPSNSERICCVVFIQNTILHNIDR